MEYLSNPENEKIINELIKILVSCGGVYAFFLLGLELGGIVKGEKGKGLEMHQAIMKSITDWFKDKGKRKK